MGVDTEFVAIVGIKKDYDFIICYNSKNDPDYEFDTKDDTIKKFENITFSDYLPLKYKVYSDGMCCLYSCIGKVLDSSEYIDEIRSMSFNVIDLQKQINEVYDELLNLGIKCNKEDVKLHSFVHFS